jgi:hypothetical protein
MNRSFSLVIGVLVLTPAAAHAQLLDLSWNTIDGGGGTSTGGPWTLSATIGQPDAGGPMTGGTFSLSGGFWPGAIPTCRPDINGDSQVNVADFLAFLSLYSAGNPRADFNSDGQVNVQDFLAFLAAYSAGC